MRLGERTLEVLDLVAQRLDLGLRLERRLGLRAQLVQLEAQLGEPLVALLELAAKLFVAGAVILGRLARFDGNITYFGLPLVRYTTEERLEEIIRRHEENGCPIFNPHRYTLEEGGMKQTDEVQLAFKREADPQGLLNPGKMIAWENPAYDYRSEKTFLFKGLQEAG